MSMILKFRFIDFVFLTTYLLSLVLTSFLDLIKVPNTGMDYFLWFFSIVVLIVYVVRYKKLNIHIERSYFYLTFVWLGMLILNYNIKYVSFLYYIIGFLLNFIPVVTFIVCANLDYKREQLLVLLGKIVTVNVFVLVFYYLWSVFVSGSFTVGSTITKSIGFTGSVCTSTVVLSMVLYAIKRDKRYIYIILFAFVTVLLTEQIKAVFLSFISIVGFVFVVSKRKIVKNVLLLFSVALFSVVIFFSNSIFSKILLYKEYYIGENNSNIARVALNIKAIEIANDNFPFGSGFGTFGSFPVKLSYSKVYEDYNLDRIWGLTYESFKGLKPNFMLDVYWASVLGEQGYWGFLLTLSIFFFPLVKILKYYKFEYDKIFVLLVLILLINIFIESVFLATPYQVSFVMIYSGLTAIIFRFLKTKNNITNEDLNVE